MATFTPKTLMEFEKPLDDLYKKIDELTKLSHHGKLDLTSETKALEERIEVKKKEIYANLTPQQIVQVSRHVQRPTALDIIRLIFTDFIEIHGDRHYADDPAMITGMAKLDGASIMVIGNQKGNTTKENIYRRWGMSNPEGYRKALRAMEMANTFGIPIVTFVDIAGAYPGLDGEERSVAEAIAKNLREMATFEVPIIVIITGEGGSGGALGIGVGNKVLMLEYSIYSVISPEGCASILFRDPSKVPLAAELLKITAKDHLASGIIDEIIKEPAGGAHNDPIATAKNIRISLINNLKELNELSKDALVEHRYNKFRAYGIFDELKPL